MIKSRTIFLTTLAMALATGTFAQPPRLIPVVSGLFSMGQWYFDGTKSELGGNMALTFVPALQFKQDSIIPTLQSNYHGTRTAEELAGGNTLFQDTWENGVNVKGVHGINENWRLKANTGFRSKWFRETADESWNHGLYDYRIMNVGTEIERQWGKQARLGLGYDFSFLRFPNYESLEASQPSDRAREFAGTNVLDENIHLLSLRAKAPLFWRMGANWATFYSPRKYTDQNIVELTGLLKNERRKDSYFGTTLSLDRGFTIFGKAKLLTTLQYGYASLDSNQNHYDASQTTFIGNFYDYKQNSIGTQFTFAFGNAAGNPMLFDLGYSYSHRNYSQRVIQSATGAYMGEKLFQIEQSVNVGFSYPLSKNFRVRTTSNFGQSKSNNDYEAVYRYNYHNAEYQFGFTYDY